MHPKVCEHCGDFFIANSGKNKYCDQCNTDKVRNKRQYQKRKSDEVQRLRQRIIEMMVYYHIETWEFSDELDYYIAVIHNKPAKDCKPYYNKNIKTEDDVIEWLHRKHDGLKGYNKRKKEQICQDHLKEPTDLDQ